MEKEAVSGDAITLVEQDDVADDEVLNVDSLAGAVLAAENLNLLVHDLLLEAQELLLLAPVAQSLDHASEDDGEEDGEGFEPLLALGGEDADDKHGNSEAEQDQNVDLIELVEEDGPE